MMDDVVVFVPYGSRLGFHEEGIAATMARMDYKFPQCVCYAIEGNVVDRVSNKNGKGWCEDVSPTLNTQDRHAICYAKTTHPHNVSECQGYEQTDIAGTLNTFDIGESRTPVIVLEGNGTRPSHMGNGYRESDTMYTLNTIEQHSVCYAVDCRNLYLNEEKSGTLQAKNVGGFSYNYLNPILKESK